jgi:hypothetical protein
MSNDRPGPEPAAVERCPSCGCTLRTELDAQLHRCVQAPRSPDEMRRYRRPATSPKRRARAAFWRTK